MTLKSGLDYLAQKKRIYWALPKALNKEFCKELINLNYERLKILNLVLLIMSIILIPIDIYNYEKGLWTEGSLYLFYTHILMFLAALMLFLLNVIFKGETSFRIKQILVMFFAYFVILTCTITSVIDQLLHGEITLFIIGVFVIAVMNTFQPSVSLGIYFSSFTIFIIGITLIQGNHGIRYGHYVNGTISIIVAWVLSYILYNAKARDFLSRKTIEQQKVELESANQQLVATNQKLEESLQALDETQNMVFSLADALESKDSYTHGHSARVAETAVELAKYLKLSEADQVNIYRAAILHDLGKIGIPDAILNKPGALTTEEWSIMRSHPERGAAICSKLNFAKEILPTIRHHHERYDGKGYPDGLKGEAIPFLARLVSVADTVDAMSSYRPYRPAVDFEKVLEELRHCAGTQLDPALVEAYIAMKTNDQNPQVK